MWCAAHILIGSYDRIVTETAWIVPTPATGSDEAPLSAAQVASWRDAGAVVVDGLVPLELVAAVRAAAVDRFGQAPAGAADFGSDGALTFPSEVDAVNDVTLHPRLLAAVGQLLGRPVIDLRLTQSDVWAKHGRPARLDDPDDNDDQRMHVDYPNHTLTHPPPWHEPDAVEMIVYADSVEVCGGPTAVVLRRGDDDPAYPWPITATPGVGGFPWINDRASAEAHLAAVAPDVARWRETHLYPREAWVRFRPATVLLYRHDTWHRGTPLRPGAIRVVHNLTFRAAASEWISTLHTGWAWAMYRRTQTMERLVATSSVEQRCVLGIPPAGHTWWTPATIAAMEARFGAWGFDPAPYLAAGDVSG